MNTGKKIFEIDITPDPLPVLNRKRIAKLKDQSRELAEKRSHEQKIKNELMAIRFEMEDYVSNIEDNAKFLSLEQAVSQYLKVLNISFRKFSYHLDIADGNLKKYIVGERKFNIDLALKFSSFFHTTPEVWLQLQLKNELIILKKEKKLIRKYSKYDYRKLASV